MTCADQVSSQIQRPVPPPDGARLHRLAREHAHALLAQAGADAWAAVIAGGRASWRALKRVLSVARVSSTHGEV